MKKFIIGIILFLASICLYSETSVWKISNGNNVLYLGGTIHVLRESDYPLPEAFGSAFEKSSIVVFEVPNNESDLLQNTKFQECIALSGQIQAITDENEQIKIYIDTVIKFIPFRTPENDSLYVDFMNGARLNVTNEELSIINKYINFWPMIRELQEDEQVQLYMELSQQLMAIMDEDESVKNYLAFFGNPDNKLLSEILGEAAFNALSEKCDKFNYPLNNIIGSRPYVAIRGLLYHIFGQFAHEQGIDSYFMNEAVKYGKKIEYFETDEFQMDLIANLGKEYGDDYYSRLISAITTLDDMEAQFDRMVDCWRRGVENKEAADSDSYERENFPAVYEAMIAKRNNAWIPIIENYLNTSTVEFVLVGAGHMYGPDGLLTQLEKKGYKIEQK